jgi:ketosteroid isomerase-like protein
MATSNKNIVEKVNAAFADNNVDGFLGYCADDVTWSMVGDTTVKGKEEIRKWMKSMDMEAPAFTVDAVIADGDRVAAFGDMTMKNKEGKVVPYSYCDVYRFRDGKIVELRSFVVSTVPKAEAAGVA